MEYNRVADEELLLHRFDTSNPDQTVLDEGTGLPAATSAAFTFHDATETTPIGCSVYRDALLHQAGVPRAKTLKTDSHRLVGATAGHVRALVREGLQILDVIPDPWPDDPDRSFDADIAHALITMPDASTRSARRNWRKPLSQLFRPVSEIRV